MASLRGFIRNARRLAFGWRWRFSHLIGTPIPSHFDDDLATTLKRVRRRTMTSAERIAALCDGVEYVAQNRLEGDIVECGVWKGGSMMAAALTLQRVGDTSRDLYLYDTFAGMTKPGSADLSSPYDGYSPHGRWRLAMRSGRGWAGVPAQRVRAAVESTGYPADRIHCVEGMVEDTVPEQAPSTIALLRLDTDWYDSTKHELVHLYPRLVEGGVLIVDDYGHYAGARRAVDEYFAETGQQVLLSRIDYTGRVAVKQSPSVPSRT